MVAAYQVSQRRHLPEAFVSFAPDPHATSDSRTFRSCCPTDLCPCLRPPTALQGSRTSSKRQVDCGS